MLASCPRRELASSEYMLARTHACSSGRPATTMSLRHSLLHSRALPASSCRHPLAAAARDARSAACRGARELRAVSTPTYLMSSYDLPSRTGKVTAWRAVRPSMLELLAVANG